MGQLKSGIEALEKACSAVGPKIEPLAALKKESTSRVAGMTGRVSEGYNVLKMTLMEKLKKENSSLEAAGNKTLQEVANGAVAEAIKGIIAGKTDLKAAIAKLNNEQKAAADKVLADVLAGKAACGKLTALASKKKDKWFKSAKYKTKIGGYLASLADINTDLDKLTKRLTALSAMKYDVAWVDKSYAMSASMKVSQIAAVTTAEFDGLLAQYEQQATTYVAGFRDEFKHMGNQLASMGKWVAEADAMEKEADATK